MPEGNNLVDLILKNPPYAYPGYPGWVYMAALIGTRGHQKIGHTTQNVHRYMVVMERRYGRKVELVFQREVYHCSSTEHAVHAMLLPWRVPGHKEVYRADPELIKKAIRRAEAYGKRHCGRFPREVWWRSLQ
jgi:hypothetical protein